MIYKIRFTLLMLHQEQKRGRNVRPFFLRFGRLHGDICGFRTTVTNRRLENIYRKARTALLRRCFFHGEKSSVRAWTHDGRRPCFMGMNSRGLLSRGKEKLAVNLFHAFAQIQNNYDELQTNMQYIAQKRRYNEYRESGHEKKFCHAFVRNDVACCRVTSAENIQPMKR